MRVVFMGTPEFAVPSLKALADCYDVSAVYTRPDAASGRGAKLRPSPVKLVAEELGLGVRQPSTLRDAAEHEVLRSLAPDVVVVAAYGLILPPAVLEVPRLGCINVHGSLLPRWRGAAPVQRAILGGDEVTGVSIMRMEEGLDTGPYCEVEVVEIDDLNADSLTRALSEAGAKALLRALERIESGQCVWIAQDDSKATYADKIEKSDVALGPELAAEQALRRIRASTRSAPARLSVAGKSLSALSATRSETRLEQGEVALGGGGLLLGLSDATICMDRVKPEGKSEMSAADWARGARLSAGTTWEPAQ